MLSFNVADVDRRAKAEAKPEDSRQVYVQDIFDWTDCYNENVAQSGNAAEAERALNQLTDLWISYAEFEISLKQWKKAVQVFDDALQDDLISKHAKIYVSYADFCKSRNKQSNAVRVYVKGLKAELPPEHYDEIWIKFGTFMNSSSPQKLSFEELFSATLQQVDFPLKRPSAVAIDIIDGRAMAAAPVLPPPSAQPPTPKIETPLQPPLPPPLPPQPRPTIAVNIAASMERPPESTVGSSAADVDSVLAPLPQIDVTLTDLGDLSNFKYPDDCRLYRHRPPSLFSSPDTEPMLSGLDALSIDELNTLEGFLQIIGADPFQEKDKDSVHERVLDVLEGLWYAQALKERHFDVWFSELIRMHTAEENDLQKMFGRGDMHKMELENLRRKNALQIELLNVIINKTLLAVLKEQQAILTSLGFPYFDHVLTVSSLAELDGPKLAAEMDQIIKQKRIISAALSLRMKPKMLLANGLSRTPLSDGKKRKKTRRKLSIGDTNGVEITTESTEYSPAAEFDPILSGTPAKRLRVESVPSPASAISIYGPGGDSGVKTSEVVTKPTAASAAGINPASLPLLQQLAKMLQKNKKNAQTASGNVSNNGNDDNSVPSVLSPSA